jgi:hypothetical protein
LQNKFQGKGTGRFSSLKGGYKGYGKRKENSKKENLLFEYVDGARYTADFSCSKLTGSSW